MSPRKTTVEQSKGVFEVEWPMFGELSRALALKVVRDYDPEIVVGIATAGVVPGAVIAAILDREFHSIIVSRRYQAESVRETPGRVRRRAGRRPRAPSADRGRDLRLGRHDAARGGRDRECRGGGGAHGGGVPDGHRTSRTTTRWRPTARSCCRGTARCCSRGSWCRTRSTAEYGQGE